MNGECIGGEKSGLVSRYNNQPWGKPKQSTARDGARTRRGKEKEKEKLYFSFLSFDAANVAFVLKVTQQSTRGGAET